VVLPRSGTKVYAPAPRSTLRHQGLRSGTKATKIAKITKITKGFVVFVYFVALVPERAGA